MSSRIKGRIALGYRIGAGFIAVLATIAAYLHARFGPIENYATYLGGVLAFLGAAAVFGYTAVSGRSPFVEDWESTDVF